MTRAILPKLATGLFVLALAITFVMALLPKPPVPYDLEANDKLWHMLAFGLLTLLAVAAFPRRKLIELFAAMAMLGGLIEVIQMIPALQRDAELMDWIADCVAVLAALIVGSAARNLVSRR